jgi:RNA polymerase sigma-70 factor (ECF subfamily)
MDYETTVREARTGNMSAFQTLVETHSSDVFRLAYRITGNEYDAEDAVQDTFLRAFQKLSTFDGRAKFGTWLYRVAANSSLDVLRRRRREASRSPSLEDSAAGRRESVSRDPGQDRLLFSSQVNERLRAALSELTELERTAFTLRHFENFPLAEISQCLGLSTNATKQAVFRAVKKVRKALGPVMSRAEG